MATRLPRKVQRNHKKLIIASLSVLAVVVVSSVSAAAYAGFMPVLTAAIGTNKPQDLGVRYSAADFRRIHDDTNGTVLNVGNLDQVPQDIAAVRPGKNLVMYGPSTVRTTLSQEEITAFLNMTPWTGSPLQHAQVRLSDGNILEFSGNVNAADASDLLKTLYPTNNYGHLGFLATLAGQLENPAVYAKVRISSDISGDQNHGNLHVKVLSLKVNRMDLTQDIDTMNEIDVRTGHGSEALGVPYSLLSLGITQGKLTYYGTAPANFAVGDGDPGRICGHFHGGSLISVSPTDGHISSAITYCR